jgi:hypothetical protein
VDACWADARKAAEEPRRLVLMRPVGDIDPTRIYAGRIPTHLPAAEVPAVYRQRWQFQERRIRELVNGANLNVNFGYTYDVVENRTRKRRFEEAQAKVEMTQVRLAEQEEAIANLWAQLKQLKQTYYQQRAARQAGIEAQQVALAARRQAGKRTRRCEKSLTLRHRQLSVLTVRFQQRRRRRIERLLRHRQKRRDLRQQLVERESIRDAIDTPTLCRERHLEKDQIMLCLQVLLLNLHDWALKHYFSPEWSHLELETAMRLIYRKPGRVTGSADQIDVVLDGYRYVDHQQAMAAICQRFNAANLRWRDGRLLHIQVAEGS